MQENQSTKSCGQCIHWYTPGGKIGECRRHAPPHVAAIQSEEGSIANKGVWPKTLKHEWCSEFGPKQENANGAG